MVLRASRRGHSEPVASLQLQRRQIKLRYLRQYIELGREVMELPLSRAEREALDLFDSIAQRDELRLDMILERGDLQWANHYTVLHSRTNSEDYDNPERRRKN